MVREAITPPILVTGGTGTLGQLVVQRLRVAGCGVRVLARHRREEQDGIQFLTGDLATGEGIEAAVEGVRTIVHCAGSVGNRSSRANPLVVMPYDGPRQ